MDEARAKITAVVCTAVFAAGLTPSAAFAHGGSSGNSGSSGYASSREVAFKVLRATARYTWLDRALKDGYERVSECVELPGTGAMGVHYAKGKLIDEKIDATKPEALVYMPVKYGKYKVYRLVAAEFLSTAEEAPVLGGITFDSEAANSKAPYRHSLHAWVWKHNPAGMFAPWNPSISCPTK
ncbi:hypothetical protein [Arthrobacter sp. Br18]|uniref:hypothetical protein n=1 Tax=Arthrobacter sp. Br18 TaxID=1312954 RepID=UPI000479CABB|nr:hypothetical protein [Arthrobacter sp. Br18]